MCLVSDDECDTLTKEQPSTSRYITNNNKQQIQDTKMEMKIEENGKKQEM